MTAFGAERADRRRRSARSAWTPLPRPLAACRLALVASAVCLAPRGRGLDHGVRVGVPSLRDVAGDVDTAALVTRSRGGDPAEANLDRNLAFALDRLREAVADGRLGALAGRHLALGGVTAGERDMRRCAPEAAARLVADGVETALLVPT
jgi:hypothetical protein